MTRFNLIFIATGLILALLLFNACSDDDSPTGVNVLSGSFSCTLANEVTMDFSDSDITIVHALDNYSMSAVDGDVTITIGFPEDAIGDINPTIAISIDGTGYIDVTPNMTISANDNDKITGTISGSFINVTNPLKSIDMTDGVLTINKN